MIKKALIKRTIATLLVASTMPVGAQTWTGNDTPINNGDILDAGNWSFPAAVPIKGSQAIFSTTINPTFAFPILGYSGSLWDLGFDGTNYGEILFYSDPFTFSLAGDSTIQVGDIVNNSSSTQTFNLNNASIEFLDVGSQGGNIVYNVSQNAYISFFTGSTESATSNYNLNDNGTLNFNQNTNTAFAGVIAGTGVVNVDLIPASTLTLTTASPNYTGTVNIVQGTLSDGGSSVLPHADYNLSSLGNLTITAAETISSLSGSGTVSLGAGLTMTSNADTTFSGVLTGAGGITKQGSGVFTLSGNNSNYTGTIGLTHGTLQAGAVGALPPASTVNLASGTSLDLNNYNNKLVNLIGSANSTVYLGEGTLTLTNASGTFAGTIYGSGGLTLSGGTFTISGTTSYTGLTTINAGTLSITANNTLGPLSGTGGVLNINGNTVAVNNYRDTTFGGSIRGAGTFVKQGEGILTLTGNNTTPPVPVTYQIQDGTIQAGSTTALSPTSAYQLFPNGTLDLNNFANSIGSLAGDGGRVTLGTATLTTGTAGTTFAGSITGTGGLTLNGSNSLTLTGPNRYSGATTLNGTTTLIAGGMNAFSPNSDVVLNTGTTLNLNHYDNAIGSLAGSGSVNLSGTLTVTHSVNTTYSGVMFGPGNFVKKGNGTFTMTGANTYTGDTVICGGTIVSVNGSIPTNSPIVDNSHLIFNQSTGVNITQNGPITGKGTVEVSGLGTLTLLGNNSYTGGTAIDAGSTLVIYNQIMSGFFNGQLFGTGAFVKSGLAQLNWCANSPTFAGTTYVNQGTFALSGVLGGNMIVNSGGTIAPGNGCNAGTFQLLGKYTQNAGSNYLVNIDGCHASFINVVGQAVLNGGNVLVQPNGCCKIENEYVILQAGGGVQGQFSSNFVQFTSPVPFKGFLSYTPNQVLLDIVPAFVECISRHCSCNQKQIAAQFDAIEDLRVIPTDLADVFNDLLLTPPWEICRVLDQLTGEQYTSNFITAELTSRQFIRRLYDPIRYLVTNEPFCDPCMLQSDLADIWFEVSGGQICNSRRKGFHGFTTSGVQVTGGIQKTCANGITGGVAASYAFDNTHFHNRGQANTNTILGGIYSLYTGDCGYWLADLAYGYSSQKMDRKIQFSTFNYKLRGTPHISEVTFYTEAGTDYLFGEALVQPFVAIEADYFHRDGVHEHSASLFNLNLHSAGHGSWFSRVGFHLTNHFCGLDLSADVAWQCRLNHRRWTHVESFTTFGNPFHIAGTPIARSSFDGALSATKVMSEHLNVYAEIAGQVWSHLSTYSGTLGVQGFW